MEEDNKKLIYVKTKGKKSSIPGLGTMLLLFIFISLLFYGFMKFIYLAFSGASVEGNHEKVSNNLLPDIFSNSIFVIFFIIFIILLLVLILSNVSKDEGKLLIEIDKNKGVKCKKCGCINDIEQEECSKCGFGSKVSYLCPSCNVYNNISNTECINCGESISLIDVKKQLQKEKNKESLSILMIILFYIISIILLKVYSSILIIIFLYYFIKKIMRSTLLYEVINTINEIIEND